MSINFPFGPIFFFFSKKDLFAVTYKLVNNKIKIKIKSRLKIHRYRK